MRKLLTTVTVLLLLCLCLPGIRSYGQQATTHSKNMLNAGIKNYTTFSAPNTDTKTEALAHNPGYENHPEAGMLFAEAPCDNCYELIGKRTENSKVFVKTGTNGRDIMQQTSSGPMHYRGPNGEWLTIKSQLKPTATKGTYAAMEQETPVVISTANKFSSLGKDGQTFRFNNNLELWYVKPDGSQGSLGVADYSHYTAGDDGVYVTNAWPGIDIEMFVVRGAIKTNFIINHAMPAYAMGKLLIRDHPEMPAGWTLNTDALKDNQGNLEVRNGAGERVYIMSEVTAFEKAAQAKTLQVLDYYVNGNTLDIAVPGGVLNKPAASYPVVIDPLVTVATSLSVNGSTYSLGWTTGCVYTNPAIVPAMVTVTDVQFTFQYVTGGGAVLNNGAYDFKLGTCRSPGVPTLFWNCNSTLYGTCDAVMATIYSQISSCLPPPQCTSYNMNLVMDFYQDFNPTSACSPTYIMAGTPLTVTVSGHTVEPSSITTTSSSICQGQSAVLTAASVDGVGPYTYTWMPGGSTGATTTVTPSTTTTYTVTTTDACGNSSTATTTINVNTVSPINGITTVCAGGTSPLTCTPSGGTWASVNPAVATINTTTGVLAGAAVGATTVRYTTTAGCTATAAVTVKALVSPIAGYLVVCDGSTTSLSDGTPAGTWSSSNTSVATIGPATGVVSGISSGSSTITYATYGGGCNATATINVNPLSAITGTLSICIGGTTTLGDAVPGGTWSTASPVVTIGATTGLVNGVSVGTASVTYTTPAGCIATTSVVVNFLNPITGTASVCQGNTTALFNAVGGGTWTSGSPGVAIIGSSSGIVTGLSGGTSLISYTIPSGCFTTKTVTVNPIAPISGTAGVCVGGTTILSDAAGPGTWTSSSTAVATIGSASGALTGISVGTSNISYTSSAGCAAGILATITLPTPTTGTTTVCQGSTTTLSNSTPGGAWSSGNPAIATVGPAGIVAGVGSGAVTITYLTPAGCAVTTPVTVNSNLAIGGSTTFCVGGTSTLSSGVAGGTWSSGATGIATADALSGVVTGVSPGAAVITYITPLGCIQNTTVNVNLPIPISGAPTVCQGSTTALSDGAPGGAWASSGTAIALIDALTGVVTGLSGGMVTISYSSSGGCIATMGLTVNALSSITGVTHMCSGNTTTLNDATPGGTWSTGSPVIATVDVLTGVVTGVSGGTTNIDYTTGAGCMTLVVVTVNPSPSPITGTTLVCSTSALSDVIGGGIWISSDPTTATVGISSGFVTGISVGTVTITYTLMGGCATTTALTVNPLTPITGAPNVCQGQTTTLTYPQPGGTWGSSNTAVATIDTSGVVTGISPGVTTIRYTTSTGCIATKNVTCFALLPITGMTTVCQRNTTTLNDGTPGGSWASSTSGVTTVGILTGVVTGVTPGTSTITYTTTSGCSATATVTVNPLQPITGIASICVGGNVPLNDSTTGGTWSSLSPGIAAIDPVTGSVAGISGGVAVINYTTGLGCIATLNETVNILPPAIGGVTKVCVGSTTTLTNTLSGGTWAMGNTAVATIGISTGIVTGVSPDTTFVTYTSSAGCVSITIMTVNPLPLPITGTTSVCAGVTSTLSDATPLGTWSSLSPGIATVGAGTGIVTGISAGATAIEFTTPEGCIWTTPFIVNAMPGGITGTTVVCEGATTTLHNSLAGGSWNSSLPAIATIGAGSGVLAGVSAGVTSITYITAAGCFVAMNATVNPTPNINGYVSANPTTCITADGTITLNGLVAGQTYSVNYLSGVTPVTITLTADGSGNVKITGLAAGTYTNFTVTTTLGCISNVVAGPIVLTLPPAPPAPIAGNNSPLCDGAALQVTATDATPGVIYSWSGPGGFTSTLQSPVMNPSSMVEAGTYTVTATILGCVSAPATTLVVIHPIPNITGIVYTDPKTCQGTEGTVTLSGLLAGVSYIIKYTFSGTPASVTLVADATGNVTITGLSAGSYSSFNVSSFTCMSNAVGPVTLKDPNPPPVPTIQSNSPICSGKTLSFNALDAITGLIYDWTGPNGFTSDIQSPEVPNISMADSGLYTLTIRYLNCPTIASEYVTVYPPVVLTDVTASKVIPFGSSIALNVAGAEFYLWFPQDGSLSNPNIPTPVATPQQNTDYIVEGMNTWGCVDSAHVVISLDDNITEGVPGAFTPNGDGLNDVFMVQNVKYDKLVDFCVYNRWGQLIYHNNYDVTQGWDGKFNGVPQDMGTYDYRIILSDPNGKQKYFKGSVTLIR